jgi:MoaA/NifB/PqqE/SkfB family radical SAM enzyme
MKRVNLGFIWFTYKKYRNERPHWFNNKIIINSCFPPYPSKAFDRFADILLNQERKPFVVNFAITSNCPYSCPHCSYGKRKNEDLSTDEILKLINEIKDMGTAILGITGGEPMLRTDLEEIVTTAPPDLTTVIFTTGYNLNKKRAEKLHKAGVGCITFGIESTDPKIQDKVRGKKGSLQNTINAIKLCKDAGIYTAIGTIGTRERLKNGELDRIYDLAKSLDVGEMRLIFPMSTGRWVGKTENILRNEEIKLLNEFQIKQNRKRSGPIVASIAYLESEDIMGCNAGYNYLFIDSSGEVCPCDLTPLSFGNIKDRPLNEIWKDMEKYFQRPRLNCLMGEISPRIKADFFPLPPNESKKLIPKLDENLPYPLVHKKLREIKK